MGLLNRRAMAILTRGLRRHSDLVLSFICARSRTAVDSLEFATFCAGKRVRQVIGTVRGLRIRDGLCLRLCSSPLLHDRGMRPVLM